MAAGTALFGSARRVSEVQVVNWGNLRGYHSLELACDPAGSMLTTLTGESGAGKSAALDAISEVLASNPRYNSASNKGGRGSSIASENRTLVSYVRGKTGLEEGVGNAAVSRLHSPLDQPTWSAVAITAANSDGGCATVGKVFWADAGCATNDAVLKVMFTADRRLDLRELEAAVSGRLRAAAVEGLGAKTYGTVTDFYAAAYAKLGISANGDPERVCSLLAAIKDGEGFSSVESLFKGTLMSEPSSLAAAQRAVEGYDSIRETWEMMRAVEEKRKMLESLPGSVEAHREATERRDRLAEVTEDAAADAVRAAVHDAALAVCEEEERLGLLERREKALARKKEVMEEAAKDYESAVATLNGAGGVELPRLESRVKEAERALDAAGATRRRLRETTAELFGDIPTTEDDFVEWKASATNRLDSAEAEKRQAAELRDSATLAGHRVGQELKDLREQRRYMLENRGRVPARLRAGRDALAAELGIGPADAPFAAELMEVNDPELAAAAEGALHRLARTVLVAPEHSAALGAAMERAGLDMRVEAEVAETGLPMPAERPSGVCSCVVPDEGSPFAGWLATRVLELDADPCEPAGLDGSRPGATAAGSVRRGAVAEAGRLGGKIIGIDNSAALREVEQLIEAKEAEAEQHRADKTDAENAIEDIARAELAAKAIGPVEFADIDTEGAKAALATARAELDEFKASNNIAQLRLRAETRRQATAAATASWDAARAELEAYSGLLAAATAEAARPAPGKAVPAEARDRVNAQLGEYGSATELWERAAAADAVAVARDAERARLEAEKEAATARTAAEAVMARYNDKWGSGFEGTTIDCAPHYLETYETVCRENFNGIDENLVMSFYRYASSELSDVDAAIDSDRAEVTRMIAELNRIMAPIPFGHRHGRLQLECRWNVPAELAAWRKKTDKLRELASDPGARVPAAQLVRETGEVAAALRERPEDGDATAADVRAHADARRRILNCSEHMTLHATNTYTDSDGVEHTDIIQSLGGYSGGECQEAMAFIQATALLSALRCDTASGKPEPSYGLVVLDEAFIKSSPSVTRRGIAAWRACGFQLLLAMPSEKAQCALEESDRGYTFIKRTDQTSEVRPQALPRRAERAGRTV